MIIYLNNFKGFTDTFIPLDKVNFLVGENSTGKSTVLSVLEMLSKTSFWTTLQLSSPEFKLGPFREVVNQFSSDKSFFQIGVEFETINTRDLQGEHINLRLLETFKEKDGHIYLDSIKYSNGNSTVFCYDINGQNIVVAKRRKHYPQFSEWVHSEPPVRRSVVPNKYYFAFYLPSLIQYVQKALDLDDYDYTYFYPLVLTPLTVFSPVRAEAHRIYETFSSSYSPQGEHIPVVLNQLMRSNRQENKAILKELRAFGMNSRLYDSLSTQGFGNSSNSPFSVTVGYDDIMVNLTNVGFGVAQSLPLAVELVKNRSTAFSIQQPEVHLHPKAQAEFGNLLFESATKNNNTFFCETHSDFIINRFRYAMNKAETAPGAQVLFFTRDNMGTHVTQIPIDSDGHYSFVPDEYMHFFIDEELKMLEF